MPSAFEAATSEFVSFQDKYIRFPKAEEQNRMKTDVIVKTKLLAILDGFLACD